MLRLTVARSAALARRTLPLLYPAMEITRALLYVSVPICFSIGLIYMIADIRRRFRGEPERDE